MLTNDYIDIPKEILDRANTDPVLSGYIKSTHKRIGIYFKERVVGFFQPSQIDYKGKTYWRTGNIYVLPEYRSKGLASDAIINFFADKEYGLAYIAFNNISSIKAFEKAGFKKDFKFCKTNVKGVQIYLMLKQPKVTPAFLFWS